MPKENEKISSETDFIKATPPLDFDSIETNVMRESPAVTDEEPDVEDIKDTQITSDNHTNCVSGDSDPLTALREVFDEETCTNLIIGFYDAYSEYILGKHRNLRILKNFL